MKDLYSELEKKMVRYQDLLKIKVKDCQENLVIIDNNIIPNNYLKNGEEMKKITGGKMYVRKQVYERLIKAQNKLQRLNNKYSLFVTYGYRSLKIQRKRFRYILKKIRRKNKDLPQTELYEAVHRMIAVPEVSGHPTGGAVDIVIINQKTKKIIDFGSKIYGYSNKKHYVFSPEVKNNAKENRLLLRNIMMETGFAPFDGEWWHFSYGDREWSFYYKKSFAIYNQLLDDRSI